MAASARPMRLITLLSLSIGAMFVAVAVLTIYAVRQIDKYLRSLSLEDCSVISIRVPLSAAHAGLDRFSWQLVVLLLVLLAILFAAQFWLARRLVLAPLARIQTMAHQVAAGGEHPGPEIPLPNGRELRELTVAFNQEIDL